MSARLAPRPRVRLLLSTRTIATFPRWRLGFALRCETAADGSPKVDAWASKQDDQPGRTEAIRRLVEIA